MTLRVTFAGPVPPITGGIASHSACTIEAMRELGADVWVVSWAAQYPKLLYKGSGIDTESETFPDAEFLMRWWDPTSWMTAGRRARDDDLLVMPWVTPVHAVPQRVISACSRGVPFSLLVHNAVPHERMPFDTTAARWVMRRAAHIVVHAEVVAEQVAALAPRVPLTVVPHPPQLPVSVTPLPADKTLRLLCLGFVREYKGFDLAVDAVHILRNRGVDVQLTIAGEVWGETHVWKHRAAADGINLIPRYVSDAEVLELLASHHMLVAPYRNATQSGSVALAFGAGRPVVASTVGGLSEAVTDGKNGRLVPARDVGALADAIEDVAENLEAYADAAAGTRWLWSDVAEALLQGVRR
jgi:glycosyltransferase involved in cell wall biosynthesis